MTELIRLQKRTQEQAHTGPPSLFSIGFRSFFFSATVAAVLFIPTWLLVLNGGSETPYFAPVLWHSHEMIFGYALAVVAGFLLTATTNWTKLEVASGRTLMALNLLWLVGRVLPWIPAIPRLLVLSVDLLFLPALILVLGRAMWRAKNRRNYFFVPVLSVFAVANVFYHLEAWGADVPQGMGRNLALRMLALLILVIGGRVFPMFTKNATGNTQIKNVLWLDRLSIAALLVATVGEGLPIGSAPIGLLWTFAGVINAARLSTWGLRSARAPLLWILHLGYFFVSLSFVLEGLFHFGRVPYASALHCFTVGGVGLLTLGMMARVSLGHSGRMLAAPRSVSFAFALLTAATLVRLLVPILAPSFISLSWTLSGALWTLAFAVFLVFGWPIWSRPRID